MIVAYVRTARPSKEAQQAQEDEIAAAMPIDRVYRDTGSGLTTHQGLRDAIDSLAAGEVLAQRSDVVAGHLVQLVDIQLHFSSSRS